MIMNEKSYPKLQKLKGTYFLPYLAYLKGRYMYSPILSTQHSFTFILLWGCYYYSIYILNNVAYYAHGHCTECYIIRPCDYRQRKKWGCSFHFVNVLAITEHIVQTQHDEVIILVLCLLNFHNTSFLHFKELCNR